MRSRGHSADGVPMPSKASEPGRSHRPLRHPFVVGVASLRNGSLAVLEILREGRIPGLEMRDSAVPPGDLVRVRARLEAVSAGIMVSASIESSWTGQCRRCLEEARGPLELRVRELYAAKAGGEEAYPMSGSLLDLQPMVRDAILLELPQVPLCRDDCAGLCSVCGMNLNRVKCECGTVRGDACWAVLDELR